MARALAPRVQPGGIVKLKSRCARNDKCEVGIVVTSAETLVGLAFYCLCAVAIQGTRQAREPADFESLTSAKAG